MKPIIRIPLLIPSLLLMLICLSVSADQQSPQKKESLQAAPCSETIYLPASGLKPIIRKRAQAYYTVKARDEKIQGTIVLSVVFHESGQVRDIRVVQGLPHGLTEQAIGTAYGILFTPAMKDGKPVSVRGSLDFIFNLY